MLITCAEIEKYVEYNRELLYYAEDRYFSLGIELE